VEPEIDVTGPVGRPPVPGHRDPQVSRTVGGKRGEDVLHVVLGGGIVRVPAPGVRIVVEFRPAREPFLGDAVEELDAVLDVDDLLDAGVRVGHDRIAGQGIEKTDARAGITCQFDPVARRVIGRVVREVGSQVAVNAKPRGQTVEDLSGRTRLGERVTADNHCPHYKHRQGQREQTRHTGTRE
jgi:hypothetical protein